MKTKEKHQGQDFIEMAEQIVGKEMFEKILSTKQPYENDDDLEDDDDDEPTPAQMKRIQELKKLIKR